MYIQVTHTLHLAFQFNAFLMKHLRRADVDVASVAKCRGSWVVGRCSGSWVKIKLYLQNS